MPAIECDVDEDLRVLLVTPSTSEETKTYQSLEIHLCRKEFPEPVFTKKTIQWPLSEPLPKEITYDPERNLVSIKSATTLAEIPLSLRAAKLLAVTKDELPQRFQRFQKFSKQIESRKAYESRELLSILVDFANNPETNHAWSKLKKKAKAFDGEDDEESGIGRMSCELSQNEQTKLLDALETKSDSSAFAAICKMLSKAQVFGYSLSTRFSALLSRTGQDELLVECLRESILLGEPLYARILEIIAKEADKKKAAQLLDEVLQRSFSGRLLEEEAITLETDHIAEIIERLVDKLCTEKKRHIQNQIIQLLTCLLDSNASRLIWNDGSHERVLRCAGVLGDMAALTDTFVDLEELRERRKLTFGQKRPLPYSIRKISLHQIAGVQSSQ
ncbi:unnamed protein product, partial [Mesorhabditis belari]|uniref:Uncharacterized protein n=1 Tax=Mesorhabditis belari TaxID=2138241 RepID=A0AAF3F1C1_9BILA